MWPRSGRRSTVATIPTDIPPGLAATAELPSWRNRKRRRKEKVSSMQFHFLICKCTYTAPFKDHVDFMLVTCFSDVSALAFCRYVHSIPHLVCWFGAACDPSVVHYTHCHSPPWNLCPPTPLETYSRSTMHASLSTRLSHKESYCWDYMHARQLMPPPLFCPVIICPSLNSFNSAHWNTRGDQVHLVQTGTITLFLYTYWEQPCPHLEPPESPEDETAPLLRLKKSKKPHPFVKMLQGIWPFGSSFRELGIFGKIYEVFKVGWEKGVFVVKYNVW